MQDKDVYLDECRKLAEQRLADAHGCDYLTLLEQDPEIEQAAFALTRRLYNQAFNEKRNRLNAARFNRNGASPNRQRQAPTPKPEVKAEPRKIPEHITSLYRRAMLAKGAPSIPFLDDTSVSHADADMKSRLRTYNAARRAYDVAALQEKQYKAALLARGNPSSIAKYNRDNVRIKNGSDPTTWHLLPKGTKPRKKVDGPAKVKQPPPMPIVEVRTSGRVTQVVL